MSSHSASLPPRRAALLGLLHGPTELLPVSSSAHTILVPLLAGWRYDQLDPSLRKSFEVSLHAAGALAIAIGARDQLRRVLAHATPRQACWLALSSAPAAAAGVLAQEPIERRLSRPLPVALALAAGGVAMAVADRRFGARKAADARAADALAIGCAQAVALVPGVSRNGAALTVARARGFDPAAAQALSWSAAAPVMLGAALLSGRRAVARGLPARSTPMLAAGAGAAFVSTLAVTRTLSHGRRRPQPLAGFALYRLAVAALVLARLWSGRRGRGHPLP
ncbi:MAG TPA: undecaprenyl-diphosphate phosphatase [Solirubrobacteraceae bacterium]|jgi:undecaprenyl-diphosphatase|nr:undecaprenyl-diphosphate phosphatase [Solirubrobacteraceae bacterium]